MVYRGQVRNGAIVLADAVSLPEGTEVRVEVAEQRTPLNGSPAEPAPAGGNTLYERLKPIIGVIDDLPEDFAENHDHYIHGTPKK